MNQYYRYSGINSDIALWAIDGQEGQNNVVIGLFDRDNQNWIDMPLIEQEQDNLIAQILKRRGWVIDMSDIHDVYGYEVEPISSTGKQNQMK